MPIVENVVTATGQQTLINNTPVMSMTSTGVSMAQVGPATSTGTPVTNAMSPYTVLSSDIVLMCATSGGAISVVLPTAGSSANRVVQVLDASGSASTNNITVSVSGGGTINGAATNVINSAYGSVTFISTGGVWIATASTGGGGGGGGGYATGVRQVAYATLGTGTSGSALFPWDNTIPQITEGFEILTCSITPQSSTSLLYVDAICFCEPAASSSNSIAVAIFRDATANAIAANGATMPQFNRIVIPVSTRMASSSTSATTFRMRVGASFGTVYVNSSSGGSWFGGVADTILRVMEVGA